VVHVERLVIAVALLSFAFGGYFWIGTSTDPAAAASLATPIDAWIPFIPESLYVYALAYVLITLPMFVVDSPALFRRMALAYATMVAVCLVCFRFFPVSGAELRPAIEGVEASEFVLWGLRMNYALDPPMNLFPSLHLAGATIAALAAGKARRAYGVIGWVAVSAVAVSVCTVKQHFWVDAAAGVALALGVHAVFLRSYEVPPNECAGRGTASLAGFFTLVAAAYGALYVAYRLGFEPWLG